MKDSPFTREEEIILLEAARIALSDAETFDRISFEGDIEDEYLKKLQEKLNNYMEK